MNLTICDKVCVKCPFSNKSAKGWLGGITIEETLVTQQYEDLFSCHLHRNENINQNLKDVESGKQPVCRGYILSASASCKLFGQNPKTGQALRQLQKDNPITTEEKEHILTKWEFKTHHKL